MCGIVGYIGKREALPLILSGLEKLEYRGYDSAGVAIATENNGVLTKRARGKLQELKDLLLKNQDDYSGKLGIGHTRWATHGRPSEDNAHPHTAGRVSLIHNGIIENYSELREILQENGSVFKSETDTEIGAHLLNKYLLEGLEPFDALKAACSEIRGSYAFLAIDTDNPDRLLIAKNATPIIIGIGEDEMVVASDIPAVLDTTRRVMILEDGDIAEVKFDSIRIENAGVAVERTVENITWDPITAQKGGYKHFMLKEIYEQPRVVADTFRSRINIDEESIVLSEDIKSTDLKQVERIVLLGCGTAWHACLVARFYLEKFTRIPCDVDYASEFRYRSPVFDEKTLAIAVSQSGETADTLAAVKLLQGKSQSMAICNNLGSSLARAVSSVIFTHAGPEISVASTKAFTTQLVALYLFALHMAQERGNLGKPEVAEHVQSLVKLPLALDECLKVDSQMEEISKIFRGASDFLFLGRGACYPIALEGALKLKEVSYIHAEGYPAGEMKHGPIALIDDDMPVVVLLQRSSQLFDKSLSNIREVESRGGKVIAITDYENHTELKKISHSVIEVPHVSEDLSPIVLSLPLQLLAYHVAVLNGTDVDLPRNLAKSVTVE